MQPALWFRAHAKVETSSTAGDNWASIVKQNTSGAGGLTINTPDNTSVPALRVINSNTSDIKGNAAIYADGTINGKNVTFNLEPDDPNNYVSTTNAQGETEQIYSGPTLDVRQVLLDLQSKVEALQAEIQTLKGGAS